MQRYRNADYPRPRHRDDILNRINGITPTGKTPLTDAVEQAARAMSYEDTPATVILISDGLESCERDPCALAEALEKGGVGFTAHVVGFGLGGDADTASLSCIAEKTGGEFLSAANADELGQALSAVAVAVAETPEPEPVVEPEPEPEPEQPEVAVNGPETAIKGSIFDVTWEPTVAADDYITIVPLGADGGSYGNYQQVRDKTSVNLRAPADVGIYELRYVQNADRVTLGRTTIEITEPEVTISGPERVVTGEAFDITWTGTVAKDDYVAIVPMGADEGTYGNYKQVRDKTEARLKAQAETGMYELRYILNEGARTLATQMIEVTEPEVTVSGPDTALAGSLVRVNWTGTVSKTDYIAIVPVGAEEGTYGTYQQVRNKTEHDLIIPGDTGLYEVRYILREGAKTLASQIIEATEPSVTLTAPDQVRIGDELTVGWSEAINAYDYINLAPMGAADDSFDTYQQVRDKGTTRLNVPEAEGIYELRYMLKANNRVIARQMIEVLGADAALNTGASLSAPESGAAGSVIEVSFEVAADSADQRVTLAKADQAIFTWVSAVKIDRTGAVQITQPDAPGIYELRYLDLSNQAVLARQTITVE